MSFKKSDYYTLVQQASNVVPGFQQAHHKFVEHAAIHQKSKSLVTNYSRNLAQLALHFAAVPHQVSTDEINSYLYRISVHEGKSEGYFKQTVHGLRYWFRVFGNEAAALRMPPLKRKQSLPTVLAKQECKELFKAPRSLKHRFLLTFAYSAGLRMNELRLIKCADVDRQRMQIHVRMGKGKKDRYVPLSKFIADKLPLYLNEVRPKTYLFEGLSPEKYLTLCQVSKSSRYKSTLISIKIP